MKKGKALVAGATGLAGRKMVNTLAQAGWDVVGIARNPQQGDFPENVRIFRADLMNKADLAFLRELGISHVFYTAHQPGGYREDRKPPTSRLRLMLEDFKLRLVMRLWPIIKKAAGTRETSRYLSRVTRIDAVEDNLLMFRNLIETLACGDTLRKVVLVTGGRYYSHHLGPFCPSYAQPFVEDMPRSSGPNWYHAVEDYLKERQVGENWHWAVLRPSALIGTTTNSLYNLATCLAVYATVLKKRQSPLLFPGTPRAFRARFDVTGIKQLADTALWAAEDPAVKNEAFNVTAAAPASWETLWPKLAALFEMKEKPGSFYHPLRSSLGNLKAQWRAVEEDHGLKGPEVSKLFNAFYLHSLTNMVTWDCCYSNEKLEKFGAPVTGGADSETLIIDAIRALQTSGIVPATPTDTDYTPEPDLHLAY